MFNIGDEVFYNRGDKLAWKEPGRILGQDGSVAFTKHSSHYINAHTCWQGVRNVSFSENFAYVLNG